MNRPASLSSADGRIFIADTNNQRLRVVATNGIISTLAGTGVAGFSAMVDPRQQHNLTGPRVSRSMQLAICSSQTRTITVCAGSQRMAQSQRSPEAAARALRLTAQSPSRPPRINPRLRRSLSFGWPIIADAAGHTVQILFTDGRLYSPGGLSTRTTTLTAAAPNAVYGTAQSTLSIAGGPGTPQGTVQVTGGGTALASASLSQGSATIALPTLNAGTHTLTATYTGDGLHPSSTATATILVSPAPVTATAAGTTISYGAPLPTLTGTLSGVLPQDQGNVTAVFTANAPPMAPVGSYPITAALTGAASANYTLSSAANSGTLTIVPAATTATLTPPSAAYATLPLQLTARVASTTSGTPTGIVQFLDAGNVIATAPLVNGSASAIELNPSSGSHTLSVTYSGDTNFRASASANVIQAVNAMPDFTVGVAGNSQQTVIAGSSATFGLTVGSQGAPFTGAVTLSANGLPAGATASFSPPAVVPGALSAPVTMTVVTRATTALNASAKPELAVGSDRRNPSSSAAGADALSRLLAVLVVAGLFGLGGCGARTASESVLPVQSFAIQVQATGTNLAGNVVVHTVNVTLGVE